MTIAFVIALVLAFGGTSLLAVSRTMKVFGYIFEHRPLALRMDEHAMLLIAFSIPFGIASAIVYILWG